MSCGCAPTSISIPPTYVSTDGSTTNGFVPLSTAIDADGISVIVWRLKLEAKSANFQVRIAYQVSSDPTDFPSSPSVYETLAASSTTSTTTWQEGATTVDTTIGTDLYVRLGVVVSNVTSTNIVECGIVTIQADLLP